MGLHQCLRLARPHGFLHSPPPFHHHCSPAVAVRKSEPWFLPHVPARVPPNTMIRDGDPDQSQRPRRTTLPTAGNTQATPSAAPVGQADYALTLPQPPPASAAASAQ